MFAFRTFMHTETTNVADESGARRGRQGDGRRMASDEASRGTAPGEARGDTEQEREKLRSAASAAHESALAASRAKSEFLATMSHEMRTPLNAVIGYTDLLALEVPGPVNGEQRTYLDRIRGASTRLLSLINDILDLTKIDSGRMIVAHERAPAEPIVRRAVAMVAQQALSAHVQVESSCDGEPAFIGDRRRVEQILIQLLSNALRFTARGGTVTISCTRFGTPDTGARLASEHRCWCAIRVEDTGIGIGDHHIASIFDPFVQAESGHTRSYEGSGLGLAIGRRLARLMGGDLTVSSRLGAGSAFTLWLPAPPIVTTDASGHTTVAGCETAERRSDTRQAEGLIDVADALLRDLDGLVRRFVERLRTDEGIGAASALDDTALEEHTATLLTDVAQSLCIIEESGGEPTQLMRDGSEIQTLIASRHGAHRHELGWTEQELDREHDLLVEVVESAIEKTLPASANRDAGVTLVRRFIERAREESRQAYRRAAVGTPPERPAHDDAAVGAR